MLYNRVKEHVVNDRKKMYKRGSQWVVVSAFALALGGVALTQLSTCQCCRNRHAPCRSASDTHPRRTSESTGGSTN